MGRGEGKGKKETRSGKIRLRGLSTAHAPSLTCFSPFSTPELFSSAHIWLPTDAV